MKPSGSDCLRCQISCGQCRAARFTERLRDADYISSGPAASRVGGPAVRARLRGTMFIPSGRTMIAAYERWGAITAAALSAIIECVWTGADSS
jgi:hypothetical protein